MAVPADKELEEINVDALRMQSLSIPFDDSGTIRSVSETTRSIRSIRSHRSHLSDRDPYDYGARNESPRRGDEKTFIERYFNKNHLDRQLKREHITGIAFSGTIGIGLFINSGEVLSFSGSLGVVLGYICASIFVVSVNRSLAEMVSVRPLQSALIDFPHTFVDPALGFATGITYCVAQCATIATLLATSVEIAADFNSGGNLTQGAKAGIIAAILVVIVLNNVVGVKTYGNLERLFKHIKILTILALCILMILVNVGVGGPPQGSDNYTKYGLPLEGFQPAGFNSTGSKILPPPSSSGVTGATGKFLDVWTAITITLFSCMGGEIVIVAAGEAKYPRRDLPAAARFMYLAPLSLYVLASFLVGFNINYRDPHLFHPWGVPSGNNSTFYSPFVIVLQGTSLAPKVLPNIFGALFLFSAYSAANTALYAASRTLFAVAHLYGNHFVERTFGRTNNGNTPIAAILFCALFGLLAFLELADSYDQAILTMASLYTGTMCCVYATECLAFLRFKLGLTKMAQANLLSRDDYAYQKKHYRARWQPMWAWTGLVGCLLILLFNGWPEIYILCARGHLSTNAQIKPNRDIAWGLVGAYLGPAVFGVVWITYSWYRPSMRRNFSDLRDSYVLPEFDQDVEDGPILVRNTVSFWVREIWSFIK